MSSIEWAVRWKSGDGYDQAPMASEEDARKQAASMQQSYTWPDEIEVIRRKVLDWVVD